MAAFLVVLMVFGCFVGQGKHPGYVMGESEGMRVLPKFPHFADEFGFRNASGSWGYSLYAE